MNWTRAIHTDVEDIMNMMQSFYRPEIAGIFTPSRTRMGYHLHQAILDQSYNPDHQFIGVARDAAGQLVAWNWVARGKYLPYANEEMAVGEFIHVDLNLPARTRMRLCLESLEAWIAWCYAYNITVLCSTSIREDQAGFMRLHDRLGFKRHGSFAYKRIIGETDDNT
jgi:YD repeat-containing protein